MFTFLAARGLSVGASLVETDKLEVARQLEEHARAHGVQLLLPTDVIVADSFSPDAAARVVSVDAIPDRWMVRLCPALWRSCRQSDNLFYIFDARMSCSLFTACLPVAAAAFHEAGASSPLMGKSWNPNFIRLHACPLHVMTTHIRRAQQHPLARLCAQQIELKTKGQEKFSCAGSGHWPGQRGGVQGCAGGLQDGAVERAYGCLRI